MKKKVNKDLSNHFSPQPVALLRKQASIAIISVGLERGSPKVHIMDVACRRERAIIAKGKTTKKDEGRTTKTICMFGCSLLLLLSLSATVCKPLDPKDDWG